MLNQLSREEIYLLGKKKAGGGGPLPSNAYYLKQSAKSNPLSITDGEELNAQSCEVEFSPIQDLHGYDSPWIDSNEINSDPYLFRAVRGTATRIGNSLFDTLVGGTVAFNQLVDSGTSSVVLTTNHKALTKVNGAWSVVNGGTIAVTGGTDMVIDLTQMFGSSIADHIYVLEQATAGSGIAWLKKYGFFTKQYYAYSANTMQSVNVSAHNTVGFNAYDNSTGKAKLVGGKEYQITGTYTALSYSTGETLTPDSNGKFTPSASGELTVTGGDNTTCVHLVWDGERDGEYEAYSEHIYPLDSDLELRGIPKLDANNNLYYDGDTYEGDGTVTRKYAVVDLGSATFVKNVSYEHIFNLELPIDKRAYDTSSAIFIYPQYTSSDVANYDYGYAIAQGKHIVYFKDKDANTVEDFNTKMQGQIFIYKVDTPFTETADAFENPQLVDNWGTEEYTDSREVQIPVGHETYHANICPIVGHNNISVTVNGTAKTTNFSNTVYGGNVDIVNGDGQNEWGYITSYNGETLPDIWISDRDAYEEGTTPTTGAEVAYKLATVTEIVTAPKTIPLVQGTNTISTDGDTVQVEYWSKSNS